VAGTYQASKVQKVLEAFSPLEGSKWEHFSDLSIIQNECMRDLWDYIPLRNEVSDRMAVELVQSKLGEYNSPSGVFIDSGHAHSIAIAVILAEHGYQPILKMQPMSGYGKFNSSLNIQAVGAMKFYSQRMLQAKKLLTKDSPPAFILNAHRTNQWLAKDFPSPTEFSKNSHLIWITEASDDSTNLLISHLTDTDVRKWMMSALSNSEQPWIFQYIDYGVDISQHLASPYFNQAQGGSIALPIALPQPQSCKKYE